MVLPVQLAPLASGIVTRMGGNPLGVPWLAIEPGRPRAEVPGNYLLCLIITMPCGINLVEHGLGQPLVLRVYDLLLISPR